MPQEPEQNIVKYDYFSGGLTESKFRGAFGSFAKAVGIDIHDEVGVIKSQFKLTKDSGATVVDKIMASVFTSGGHSYHFGDAGKIYKRTSAGTWSVLATVTGTPKILGADEHSDGYVYFTYSNKVGRILVSSDAITESWNTLTNTNTNYGPVIYFEKQDRILIGNKELVAAVLADSSFDSNSLDFHATFEIRDISTADIDVLVGFTHTVKKNKSWIVQWDGFSTSWQFEWFLGEEIKWIQNHGDINYIMVGDRGKVYEFAGSVFNLLSPITKIPGTYTNTATFESNHNSKVVFRGFLHFGVYDAGAGNPFPNGVYTYGTKDVRTLPKALNCEYVISQDKVTAIEIGALSTDGANLFVAWKDGSTYGVDKIDFATRYASSYIEFRVMALDKHLEKDFLRFPTEFKPLAASCTIELQRKVNDAASFTSVATLSTANDVDDQLAFKGDGVPDGAKIIQTKLILGVSGTSTPEIFQHAIVFTNHEFV